MRISHYFQQAFLCCWFVATVNAADKSYETLIKYIGPKALVDAAWKTHANYIKTGKGSSEKRIPPECWADAIRRLNPTNVYLHMVNVVVVLRQDNKKEEGLYLCIPISSYAPRDGEHGFHFKEVAPDIQYYWRMK